MLIKYEKKEINIIYACNNDFLANIFKLFNNKIYIIPIYHIMIWQSRSDYKEKKVS